MEEESTLTYAHLPAAPHANFSTPFAQPPLQTTGQLSSPQPTPATSNLPSNMTSVSANNTVPAQQRPSQGGGQTPAQTAREKARVTTLLDINSMLLQEVITLQAAGKAGGPPTQQGSQDGTSSVADQSEPPKSPAQKPSPEYIECMRRLQANLAYLAAIADRAKKSGSVPPTAPAIMNPPPNMSSMNEIYAKLNDLFPRNPAGGGTPQPSPQALQGNGKPSPSPGAEAAV